MPARLNDIEVSVADKNMARPLRPLKPAHPKADRLVVELAERMEVHEEIKRARAQGAAQCRRDQDVVV